MILWRASFRHLLRHPWQTILAVVGVALGVGVVTAIDLANGSANRAFRLSAEALAGTSTHQVLGGSRGLPEKLYPALRLALPAQKCAPVVEGRLCPAGPVGTTLRLQGVDPFAGAGMADSGALVTDASVLEKLLAVPGTILLLRSTADGFGVVPGGTLTVEANGAQRQLRLAGYLEPTGDAARVGLASVAVADIATAQEVLGMGGVISRIDLVVEEGKGGEAQLAKIRGMLPSDATVVTAGARAGQLENMTRAFRLNLAALSLLALVVGMFLIYNTITFSVVRRRRLIGLLRAVGVTRRQVFLLVIGEALLIGILGTLAGLLFGILLGEELTRLVTRTINDLYFVMEVRSVQLLPASFVKAGILGIAATVAAALPPVLEATATPPRAVLARSVIEARTRRLVPLAAGAGVVTLLVAGAILPVERWGIVGGFAGLFGIIVGYGLLVPGMLVGLSRLFQPLVAGVAGVLGAMAVRGIRASLSRTGVATAALVVAVSATIGVGIMVGSFRLTVQHWLGTWLQADIYVTSAGTGTGRHKPPLDPALVERLAVVPGAAARSLTRRVPLDVAGGGADLLVMDQPQATFLAYRFKDGDPGHAWQSYAAGTAVIVSEPYAFRHSVKVGDRISLATPSGSSLFPVAGIFYDYGSDQGVVAIHRTAYLRLWHDATVDGMGFYGAPGVTPAMLAAAIGALAGRSTITIISNQELRRASLAVFDRTFAITAVLRLLILVVAFVGILSALMAIQVERARELAVARALGLTSRQVWGVVSGETLLIGLIAGLLSLPLGILQALVLIRVVNRRSFGWTMELALEPALLVQAVALSLAAAFCAAIYPSLAISRTLPALALKEDG